MAQIEDGKGTGNRAEVNKENQLIIKAISESELEYESEVNGLSYTWASDIVDVAAGGGTVLLIKNLSDSPLHILSVIIANGAVASEYTIHLPTTEVTPTGVALVGTNMNTASSNVADALAKTKETDNTQGNVIGTVWLAVDRNISLSLEGVILGKNKSIAVDVVEDTAESAVTIIGHYTL